MKKSILLFFLSISTLINAQTTNYVKTFGSTGTEKVGGLQVNSKQDIYMTGTFGNNMSIDTNNLFINGLEDIFLYKENANGQVIWTKTFGSHGQDKVTGFRLFNDSTLYFSGIYWDSISFDNTNLYANDNAAFIAKADISGNILWARSIDGGDSLKINEGVTDTQGNYIIIGSFSGSLQFPNMTLIAQGTEDGFVAKYDENGNFLWAKRFGNQQQTIATSVAVDDLGDVYVVGQFNGQIVLESDIFNAVDTGYYTYNLNHDTIWGTINDFDIFLVKYNDNGSLQYSKHFGGDFNDTNPKLGIGTSGKVVMAGEFRRSLNLNAQTSIFASLSPNTEHFFLITLSSMGSLLTHNTYRTQGVTLTNLTINNDDYYISGSFRGTLYVSAPYWGTGPNAAPNNFVIRTKGTDLASDPNRIVYVSTLTSSTAFVAPYYDIPNSEIAIGGTFEGTLYYVPFTSNGSSDIFITKLSFPPVSTSIIENEFNINIFPNPAMDFINIELNDLVIDSPVVIEVINTIGQVEKRLNIENQNQIRVPIYHLPKGIYFLRMKVGEKQVVRKFIKN